MTRGSYAWAMPRYTGNDPDTSIVGMTGQTVRGGPSCLFGRTTYRPGGFCGPRTQRMFQLVVVTRGRMRATVDGVRHTVEVGEGLLLHPGRREFLEFQGEHGAAHTWCEIGLDLLDRPERRTLRARESAHPVSSTVHNLIAEGLATTIRSDDAFQTGLRSLVKTCLLWFASDAASRSGPGNKPHPILEKAMVLLSGEAPALSSASALARRTGISVSRLRAIFREAGLESPSELLWRMKSERAAQMICSTGHTLAEVAGQCGFANPFHMSRRVKRLTGLPPRTLRRREWS
jgi:AraC family transcriptional regulator